VSTWTVEDDNPMQPSTEDPRTHKQKRGWLRTSFTMGDRLDYRVESLLGASSSKTIAWETLPSSAHFEERVQRDFGLIRVTIITTVISVLAVLNKPNHPLKTLAVCALMSVLLVAVRRAVWPRAEASTILPVPGGAITVLREKFHDRILEELEARRQRCLAALNVIQANQSRRQNLYRIRRAWLVEARAQDHGPRLDSLPDQAEEIAPRILN
jgi:hypothetical protein